MPTKRVRAKNIEAARRKAKGGKRNVVVTDVNMIDATRNRKEKTYSVNTKTRKGHKPAKTHRHRHHRK